MLPNYKDKKRETMPSFGKDKDEKDSKLSEIYDRLSIQKLPTHISIVPFVHVHPHFCMFLCKQYILVA